MATSTVRISHDAQQALRQIARQEGRPMHAVIESAIAAYQQKQFLEGVNRDYAALRRNPKASKEEVAERKLWDRSLRDGITAESGDPVLELWGLGREIWADVDADEYVAELRRDRRENDLAPPSTNIGHRQR